MRMNPVPSERKETYFRSTSYTFPLSCLILVIYEVVSIPTVKRGKWGSEVNLPTVELLVSGRARNRTLVCWRVKPEPFHRILLTLPEVMPGETVCEISPSPTETLLNPYWNWNHVGLSVRNLRSLTWDQVIHSAQNYHGYSESFKY